MQTREGLNFKILSKDIGILKKIFPILKRITKTNIVYYYTDVYTNVFLVQDHVFYQVWLKHLFEKTAFLVAQGVSCHTSIEIDINEKKNITFLKVLCFFPYSRKKSSLLIPTILINEMIKDKTKTSRGVEVDVF